MPEKYIQIRLTSSAFSTLDRLSTELEQACQDNFVNVSNEWLESRKESRDDVIVSLLANNTFEPTDIFGIPFYEEAKLTLKLKIQRLSTLDRRIVLIFDTENIGLSPYDANRFRKVETEHAMIKYSDKNINSQFRVTKYEQDMIFRPERLQLTTEGGTYKSYPAHADLCLNGDRTDIETTFSCQDGCFMTGLRVDDLYNPRTVDLDTRRSMMMLKRTPQKEPQRRGSNWGGGDDDDDPYRPGRGRYGYGQCRPNRLFSGSQDPDDDEDWHRKREAERRTGAVSRSTNTGLRPPSNQGANAVTPSQVKQWQDAGKKKASGSQRPETPKLPQILPRIENKAGDGCWGIDDVASDQHNEENDQNNVPDPGEANFALPNAIANQVMLHGNWTNDQMELLNFTRNEASRILRPPEIKSWISSIKRNTYMDKDTKSVYSDIIKQDDEVSVVKVMDKIMDTFADKCSVVSTDRDSLLWDDFDSEVKERSSSRVSDTNKNVLTESMRGTNVVRGGVMAPGAWAQGPPRPYTPGSPWTPRHQGPPPYRGRGAGSSRGSVASPRPGYRPYEGQGGRGYQGHAGGQVERNQEPSRGRGSPRDTSRGPPSVSPSRSWSDREANRRPETRSPIGSMSSPQYTEPLKQKIERINTEDYEDEEIRDEKWIKNRTPCRFLDDRRGGYVMPTHESFTSSELNNFYRKKLKKEHRKVAALVYHRVFLLSKCYQHMLTLYVRRNPFANNEIEEAIEAQDRGIRKAFNVAERELASETEFVSFVMSQGQAFLILLKHLCKIVRNQSHTLTEQDIFDINWARGAVVCHQVRTHDGFLQIYQDQIEINKYKIKLTKKALQSYPNSACSLMPPGPIPSELSNDLHELQRSEGLIQDEQPKEGKKGKKKGEKVKNLPARLGGEGKKNFSASVLVNKFLNYDNGAEEKVEEMEKELKEFEDKLKPQGYKAKIDTYFFLVDSAKNVKGEGKFEKLRRQRATNVAESLMMTVCCINADAMEYKNTRLMEQPEAAEHSHGDNEQAKTSPEPEGEKARSLTEVVEPMEVTEPIDPGQSLVTIQSPNDVVTEVTGIATDVVMGNGVSPSLANSQLDGAMGSPEVADKNLKNEKGKNKE